MICPLPSNNKYGKIYFFFTRFINIKVMSTRTFFYHQKDVLHQAVRNVWVRKRNILLEDLKDKELVLGGDARCDSMGHCAKFGSYSLMELDRNKIITTEIVQVNC
jgi:hypothetical protein